MSKSNCVLGMALLKNIFLKIIANVVFFVSLQERRDLGVGHSALDHLGTSAAASGFTNTNRLRHTPTTDFQPPYFPPPYAVNQTPVDFPHHNLHQDPYGIHANPYANSQHHQPYGVNHADRHHILANDPLNSMSRGFPSAYDSRRHDYASVVRPEGLIPSRTNDLHESGILNIPHGPMQMEDQVSSLSLFSLFFSFDNGVIPLKSSGAILGHASKDTKR